MAIASALALFICATFAMRLYFKNNNSGDNVATTTVKDNSVPAATSADTAKSVDSPDPETYAVEQQNPPNVIKDSIIKIEKKKPVKIPDDVQKELIADKKIPKNKDE
ncbi:MAG: hypothetical protein HC817_10105 [Saprospiraceae bacterium]|nr:hypothetical protein [Saprospiraceae bacterium]